MKNNLPIFKIFYGLLLIPLLIFCSFFINVTLGQSAIIDFDSTHQVVSGFGAANILPWRADMTANEINTAFGTGDGQLGFSILRLRLPNSQSEFAANVSTALQAHNMGVKIIASPWSPPVSMKSNSNIVGGRLNDTAYDDYAAHLNSFINYMSTNGVPIYAVSVQNEPDVNVTYESCDWNASEMLTFVKENGSSIAAKLIAPESYHFDPSLSDPILNDSAATANVDIIGGHIYGGGLVPYPLAGEKGKEIWMTEHLTGNTGSANDWTLAFPVAAEINDVMHAGMSAYIWWYIVRFYGPISDGTNNSGTKGTVTKKGYIMSQFSRFIRPGYHRVESTYNPRTGVYITAYKDSSKFVIVAINNNSSPVNQTFTLQNGTAERVFGYVTSQTKNCFLESDIEIRGGTFTATLDASSINTFVSEGDSEIPVELSNFSASVAGNKVMLSWSTASETNNAGFEVQRSADNVEFHTIAFVEGKGTTTERHEYSYIENISGNKFYYRLKQVDFNGTGVFSGTVGVSAAPEIFSLEQNFPNPFNPTTTIRYSVPESGFLSIKLFNQLGEEVAVLFEGSREAGNYSLIFDGTGFSSGIYYYRFTAGNFIDVKKLILLK